MKDDATPEGSTAPSFPAAPSESPFRVPASRPRPVASAPPVVVSRPEPPVVAEKRASSAPARPAAKPAPPLGSGMLFEPRRSHPFISFLAEHPRLGGLVALVGFGGGALYLASRIAHPGRLLGRGRALQPVFMHASAALAFAGLWFLLVEVPIGEKDVIPTWWKVGLAVFAVLGAALVKPITGLIV